MRFAVIQNTIAKLGEAAPTFVRVIQDPQDMKAIAAILEVPGQAEVVVTESNRIYEVTINGTFRETKTREIDFSVAEFEAFLASRPSPPSIEALNEYVHSSRKVRH